MSQRENHPGEENHESNILNIVLLGQAGTGKSASGNTILGTPTTFKSEKNSLPVTKECQEEKRQLFGTEVRVIDTPDFFHENVEYSDKHVIECKKRYGVGARVYLLVIPIDRFTEGKRGILKQLEEALGEIRDKTIVLFTFGEQLTNTTFDEFIKNADPHLKDILSLCEDRYHLFKNIERDHQQVEGLMEKIRKLLDQDKMFPDLHDRGKVNNDDRRIIIKNTKMYCLGIAFVGVCGFLLYRLI